MPLLAACLAPCRVTSQTAPRPEFEVASLKVNNNCGNSRNGGRDPSPGRVNVECIPLRSLMRVAYGTFADGGSFKPARLEVTGGPSWLDSELYNLDAKAAPGTSLDVMFGPMLQVLLEQRCQLKVHKETRQLPVYELTVARGGPKLHAAAEGSCVPIDRTHVPAAKDPGRPEPHYCGARLVSASGIGQAVDGYGMTMVEFSSRMLLGFTDRPVIDKTGLPGRFDIHLEFARDVQQATPVFGEHDGPDAPAPPPEGAGPSIFTAVQEQLGLKLLPAKGPVEVLVVDRVARPTEN